MPQTERVAVVTGSSQGIGRGIAEVLAASGMLTVVHYAKSRDMADEVVNGIIAMGGAAFAVGADIAAPGNVAAMFAEIDAGLDARGMAPRVDVLVNNAAEFSNARFAEASEDMIDRMLAVNFKAPFLTIQQAAARMPDGGRIINLSSLSAHRTKPIYSLYAPAKAALEALTRAVSKDLAPRGITVNAIAPGLVLTGHVKAAFEADAPRFAAIAAESPFNRAGRVDDITGVVAFLVSEQARWITGQTIHANGGSYP